MSLRLSCLALGVRLILEVLSMKLAVL
uniref:Uncharacterized protein n=1 Tax=Rhizophora mucronata TaxID=61149 RepID=A0A2P2MU57_RHIMU